MSTSGYTSLPDDLPSPEDDGLAAHLPGLELPIINEIFLCLHEGKPAREALRTLMSRPVLDEMTRVVELMGRAK